MKLQRAVLAELPRVEGMLCKDTTRASAPPQCYDRRLLPIYFFCLLSLARRWRRQPSVSSSGPGARTGGDREHSRYGPGSKARLPHVYGVLYALLVYRICAFSDGLCERQTTCEQTGLGTCAHAFDKAFCQGYDSKTM